MPAVNPWKSYRQVATQTAPPGQLILMLFDGALKFLNRGLTGFNCTDPAEANMTIHNNFQRALDIVRELNRALNLEQGGECAETFRRLYDYFERRIADSNVRKRPDGAREVIEHLTVMRDAWAAMLAGSPRGVITTNPNPPPGTSTPRGEDSSKLQIEGSRLEPATHDTRNNLQPSTLHLQPA